MILIPTVTAARLPDGAGHAAVDFIDKALLRVRTNLHDPPPAAMHELQTLDRVADLGFDHEDDGIVAQSGVGTEEYEEIGEAADGNAKIGGHTLPPGVVNFHPALPHHANADERFGGTEARAINQNVDRALHSIVRDDAAFPDLGDSPGDKFHIGAVQRRIEIIRNENALAAQLIVGRQRGAQFGVCPRPSCGRSDCRENRGRELPGARRYIAGRPSA